MIHSIETRNRPWTVPSCEVSRRRRWARAKMGKEPETRLCRAYISRAIRDRACIHGIILVGSNDMSSCRAHTLSMLKYVSSDSIKLVLIAVTLECVANTARAPRTRRKDHMTSSNKFVLFTRLPRASTTPSTQ